MKKCIAFAMFLGLVLNGILVKKTFAESSGTGAAPAHVDLLPQFETISKPASAGAAVTDPLPQFETIFPTPTPRPKTDLAVTVAFAIPQPLTLGVQAQREGSDFAAFFEGGFFRYPFSSADNTFSDYSFEAGVRYHPFHNWFFVTGELGYRELGLSVNISNLKQGGVALANTATLSVGTFYFGALLGGEWRLFTHLALALDAGVQLALIHTGNIQIIGDSNSGDNLSVDDSQELSRISGLPLPQVAVLRFVWYL